MSGHSKWSNIKRKKEVNDKAKGTLFAKLSRMITLAVKEGKGIGDATKNVNLRLAIDQAKKFNMPKETIDRAVSKGIGGEQGSLNEVTYEAFGPGRSAFIVHAITDNLNRTATEVRNTLDLHNGKLGQTGSVQYLFDHIAYLVIEAQQDNEEIYLNLAEKIHAIDIIKEDNRIIFYFPIEFISEISAENNFSSIVDGPQIIYIPQVVLTLEDSEEMEVHKLREKLEELEDIQAVYVNV